jgi:hypothetical protein
VNDGEKKGHVEKWLLEIEGMMRQTLKSVALESQKDNSPRI